MIGIETHSQTDEFCLWSCRVTDAVLKNVLELIERSMTNGVIITCGDDVKGLCFPVVAQSIGDMEEQWTLPCLVRLSCPKCPKRFIESWISGSLKVNSEMEAVQRQPEAKSY
jgi:hypothetical protein